MSERNVVQFTDNGSGNAGFLAENNTRRGPHLALGILTPMEFAVKKTMDKMVAKVRFVIPKVSSENGGCLGLRSLFKTLAESD